MLFAPRPKGLGSENFLKLSDGEEITGLFKGGIYTFKKHWAAGRGIECSGDGCDTCKAEAEFNATVTDSKKKKFPAFRFRINFIISKDGKWLAKIFEHGGKTYDLLTKLNSKVDLTSTFIDITRHGSGQGTEYSFFHRSDEPLTKEMKAKIDAVELLALCAEKVEQPVEA